MMIRNKDISLEYVYFLFLGFFAFSGLGGYILNELLDLRFYVIEIYFLPFFLFNYRQYFIILRNGLHNKYFILFSFFIIYGITIGSLYTCDPLNVLTMTRSLLYLVILIYIFSVKKQISINKLFILVLGAIIGDFAYALFLNDGLYSPNIFAIVLAMIIANIRGYYFVFIFVTLIGLILSINGGFRICIVAIMIIILEVLVWNLFRRNRKKDFGNQNKRILFSFVIIMLGILIFLNYDRVVYFIADIFHMDSYVIFRITERLKAFLELDFLASQDHIRLDLFRLAFSEFFPRLLPRGLVKKSIGSLGEYIDVPITYFYDAFGSILSIIILAFFIIVGLKAFLSCFRNTASECYEVCGLMFPVYMLMLVINGSFLYITYEVILTGVVVGLWLAQNKK